MSKVWVLLLLLLLVISCTLIKVGDTTPTLTATPRPLPTYTPFPTYTPLPPLPTYTPFPTYTPLAVNFGAADIAQDTALAEAINEYRIENGVEALRVSYHLMNIAASRVYLTMLPGVDLGVVQIDPRVMPSGYAWTEWTFGGDNAHALSVNTPEAVIEDMVERRGESEDLLSEEYRDVGAVLLCNGERCGYVIILGRPYP